ncbi:thioredoxin domain-containing protein [Oceanobacillus piezotolerans]|uniref:Thioredoxin domain-containing protein n=1 Tax=Oceanobacillus piezotolerans TaxID=2448030 RepID=A0A498DDJ1_9BACI|nr:thioredoxin domain-containing protein [Oceanobacillus piezotolerans]RLL46730.1 thioredoxin domain-containing protein [Oceanobacillus piezotolerans]
MTSNQKPNKLIAEKSPYLLQHAHNPVDWYPWGDKAFEKAKRENKPIFLSIGYSTCHWCHVMAHESFEDEEVAALLNEHYISIKVDREERPDVDSIYMKVCQMMAGHGGWPLTIFMTPDKIPFYAGTYFPKNSKYGRPGIMEALQQLHKQYTETPDKIDKITASVTDALQRTVTAKSDKRLTKDVLHEAYQQLGKNFDFIYGGFGEAPKFPMPQNLLFLLRQYYFTENAGALKIVEKTLKDMVAGGIWDHIGFGFSRYSTDEEWLVPHFEKMLYDNALLLIVYTECFQITKNPLYRQIAEQIITFIKKEMTSKDGAFYSAIDADSEGVEGKYYVWSYDEVIRVLGIELGEQYASVYDITPEGNFEGKNIPNLIDNDDAMTEDLQIKLESARQQLLQAREQRVYPHVDDKILTSWNSMMIAALAMAGKVFANDKYISMAETALQFIEEKLVVDDRLMARYRDGETKYKAYLDDYAFLLWGYLELYDATFALTYLEKSRKLADQMLELFWDEENGGFFFSGIDSETLIAKDKEIYDGALPSGNSVAGVMLTRLGQLTGETSYLENVEEMYYTFYDDVKKQASASPFFLQSLQLLEFPTKEVVVLGEEKERSYFLKKLQADFLPDASVLTADQPGKLVKTAPYASSYKQLGSDITVYVCENFACHQPTTNLEKAFNMIKEK